MKSISFCCLILTLLLGFVYAKDEYVYAIFEEDKAESVKSEVLKLIKKNKNTFENQKKFEELQLNFHELMKGSAFSIGSDAYVYPETDYEPIYKVYVNPKIIDKVKAVPGVITIENDLGKVYQKAEEIKKNKATTSSATKTSTTTTKATTTKATTTKATTTKATTTKATTTNATSTSTSNASNVSGNASNNVAGNANNNLTTNVNNTTIINGNATANGNITNTTPSTINTTSGVSSNTVLKISNVLIAIFAVYLFC